MQLIGSWHYHVLIIRLVCKKEMSLVGHFWDKKSPQNNTKADERFYRKPVDNIPPYLAEVLDFFRPDLHRVRFTKLMPGASVKPHIDYNTTYSIRLHIPILTSPECEMGVKIGDKVHKTHFAADGGVYFINQGFEHWATNLGSQPRVHIILSVDSHKYLDL